MYIQPEVVEFADKLIHDMIDNGLKEAIARPSSNFNRSCEEKNIYVASGLTKMVFLNNNLKNWVLKVAYNSKKYDYCQMEADNYRKAQEEGVDQFFAQTYFFKEVDDVKFYIQERVRVDEEAVQRMTSDSFYDEGSDEEIEDYMDDFDELDDDERIERLFPEDQATELEEFVEENNINDLHSGNWGWTEDGRLVVMDYSGFFGCE